jgi:hypothetical protein
MITEYHAMESLRIAVVILAGYGAGRMNNEDRGARLFWLGVFYGVLLLILVFPLSLSEILEIPS